MNEAELVSKCVRAHNVAAKNCRSEIEVATRHVVRAILMEVGVIGSGSMVIQMTPEFLVDASQRLTAAINANLKLLGSGVTVEVIPDDLRGILFRAAESSRPEPTKRTMQDVLRDIDAACDNGCDTAPRRLTDELIALVREETAR